MEIAEKAMGIAADLCVYTNDNFVKELLPLPEGESEASDNDESTAGGVGAGDDDSSSSSDDE